MSESINEDYEKEEVEWKKLNAGNSGRLEERVHAIRLDPCGMTRIEAKISALAEIGCSPARTAVILGRDEHTILNHRADIRRKKKVPRDGNPFEMIFIKYPPPRKKKMKNNLKPGLFRDILSDEMYYFCALIDGTFLPDWPEKREAGLQPGLSEINARLE